MREAPHLRRSLVGDSRIFFPKNPINKVRKGSTILIFVKSKVMFGEKMKKMYNNDKMNMLSNMVFMPINHPTILPVKGISRSI